MIDKIYNKLLKLGNKWNNGRIGKIVNTINTDPEAGWVFLTTVLLLGGLGVGLCLLWFYLMLKQGIPIGWIIFEVAIILFCVWAVIGGIIPMSRTAYKMIRKKRENMQNADK